MSTHTGKIGRLPAAIREQVNQRLEDGEAAGPILEWLNALPAVREIIATRFGGHPINEQNLSNWRAGGFEDWLRKQDRVTLAGQILEEASELDATAGGKGAARLAQGLATILLVELARAARQLSAVSDPADHARQTQRLIRAFVQMRREENRGAGAPRQRAEAAPELADLVATPPAAHPVPPAPASAPSPARMPPGVQEISKVLDLYPDLASPYALPPR